MRNRLVDVKSSSRGRLQFSFDTLATKVLLCSSPDSPQPKAYGVEIAVGAALPVASNFKGKAALKTQNILVKHEVIVSAGVFQTPQLVSTGFSSCC